MAAVWLAAIAISAASMGALVDYDAPRQAAPPPTSEEQYIESAPFAVFIGSSPFLYALPEELPAAQFFSKAASTDRLVRLAQSERSEAETMRLLRLAIDNEIRKIYVEITPLVVDLRREETITSQIRDAVRGFSFRLRAAVLEVSGLFKARSEDEMLAGVFDGNPNALNYSGLPKLHSPSQANELIYAIKVARQKQIDLVFVAMPRSQAASLYLGPKFESRLSDQLSDFSNRFDAKVWRPDLYWPNEYFVDQGHMNAAGRARFEKAVQDFEARSQ